MYDKFKVRYNALGKVGVKRAKKLYAQNICKQSWLDSIDVMIEQILNQDTGSFGGSLDKTSAIFGSNKRAEWTINYLQEQRKLIYEHE